MRLMPLALLLAGFITSSCIPTPHVHVVSGRFLEERTSVKDVDGDEIFAKGYLLLHLGSDVNLSRYAAENDAEVWYRAETCDTHAEMDGWPYLYVSKGNEAPETYILLVPYKGGDGPGYNLARHPEDLCIRVGLGSMNPLENAQSAGVRYSLDEPIRKALATYDAAGGVTQIELADECKSHLCRPRYLRPAPSGR